MQYIFPCSVSLPSQSVQLLFTFFCFQSNIQIVIGMSLCDCNCLLCLTLLCILETKLLKKSSNKSETRVWCFSFLSSLVSNIKFLVYLFSIFISYFFPCFLASFFSFYALLNFLIPPPCLSLSLIHFPNVTPSTVSAVFLAFLLFCSTHQVTHPCLPESWSPLV